MKLNYTNFGRAKSIKAPTQVLEKYHRKPKVLQFVEISQWVVGIGIVILGLAMIDTHEISSLFVIASGSLFLISSVLCGLESQWFKITASVASGLLLPPIFIVGFYAYALIPLAYLALYNLYVPIIEYHAWCKSVSSEI